MESLVANPGMNSNEMKETPTVSTLQTPVVERLVDKVMEDLRQITEDRDTMLQTTVLAMAPARSLRPSSPEPSKPAKDCTPKMSGHRH